MTANDADVQLVTIRKYASLPQALMAREQLEEEGIPALVPDEHAIGITGYTFAYQGVRLQVRSDDVERANEILGDDEVA